VIASPLRLAFSFDRCRGRCYYPLMPADAKEFIDFWIENSVHAKLDLGQDGSSQDVDELTSRLLISAREQGLSPDDISREIGAPAAYIKSRLDKLNQRQDGLE
jgi:hypothetical protein